MFLPQNLSRAVNWIPTAPVNPMTGKPSEVIYEDGIYVGYRYYQTFHVKTAYPFGYGLSYTQFKYSNLILGSTSFKDKMQVSVTVTNTGNSCREGSGGIVFDCTRR